MAEVDVERCSGCGICEDFCQFFAIAVDGESDKATVEVRECMGCGVCETKCPEDAVSLVRNPGVALDPVDLWKIKEKHRS
jgi:MinD superfamily P-loop ATPase